MQKYLKPLLSCLCIGLPSLVFADINTLYLQEGTAVLKGSEYSSRTICSSYPFKQKYIGYVCKGSEGISLGKTVKETDKADQDYGLTFCMNGFWPNSDRTKCERATDENSTVHNCKAGYMSWKVLKLGDKDECIKCTDENLKKALSVLPDDLYPDKTVKNYYCNGGKYRQPHSGDDRVPRGLSKCLPVNNQIESHSNADHSGCEGVDQIQFASLTSSSLSNSSSNASNDSDASNTLLTWSQVQCAKGEVYYDPMQKCVPCASNQAWIEFANEARSYCAGGTWPAGTTIDKQLTKCPNGSWPNASLTGCDCIWGEKNIQKCKLQKKTADQCECTNVQLTKADLYYGPQGAAAPLHKQCWTKTSDDAYKVCMGFDN